jgi:hypothetical protein
VEQERGQELPRLAAPDRERLTVAARHERAEQAELDAVRSRRGAILRRRAADRRARTLRCTPACAFDIAPSPFDDHRIVSGRREKEKA